MIKGKIFLFLCLTLVLVNLTGVKADFSYEENYDSYTRQYDIWVYDIDVDDEDTRITVKHTWSSPRYSYDYETGSDMPFDYAPATPRYTYDTFNMYQPARQSYDVGRELSSAFGRGYYRPYYSGYGSGSWTYRSSYW